MNWLVFALVTWIMLGLEIGLKSSLRLGDSSIAPSFVAILAVFVATAAPPRTAQWACLLIGALVDLTSPIPRADAASSFTVLGPNALGALLMCQLVLAVRGLLFRRNPLTVAVLAATGFAVWQVVVTAVFTVRDLTGDPVVWVPAGQLGSRMASSLYTGLLALPLSLLLLAVAPLFSFQFVASRYPGRRGAVTR